MNQKLSFVVALLASCANPLVEICDDSVDNDFDGITDCADSNCSALPACVGVEDCNIPGDEDGNQRSDCDDIACAVHPLCTPELNCGDAIDNDSDGATDCSDEDCFDSQACQSDTCGDGFIDNDEECDGENLGGFDCSSLGFSDGVLFCSTECSFDTSSCVDFGFCGDGILDPFEECDDGNFTDGDGCTFFCTIEFCGDGLIGLGEECDDGNFTNGDGCSSFCTIEFSECGDGIVSPDEACDDGNNTNGDGCDAFCQFEDFIEEIEPNEDGTPEPNGDTLTGNDFDFNGTAVLNAISNGPIFSSINITAAISPAGDEDVFAVTNGSQSLILFSAETFGEPSLSACPDIDTVVNLRNEFSEILATSDDDGQDLCSIVSNFPLEPGQTLFVHVLLFGDLDETPQYFLQIRFQ